MKKKETEAKEKKVPYKNLLTVNLITRIFSDEQASGGNTCILEIDRLRNKGLREYLEKYAPDADSKRPGKNITWWQFRTAEFASIEDIILYAQKTLTLINAQLISTGHIKATTLSAAEKKALNDEKLTCE